MKHLWTNYIFHIFEIRQADDLQDDMDGLIIPGGESTVMGKLLKELSLYEPLKAKIEAGLPVFGTCAGLLLLAKDIDGEDALGFRTMNIIARRNAYGRQLGSFFAEEDFKGNRNGRHDIYPRTVYRACR